MRIFLTKRVGVLAILVSAMAGSLVLAQQPYQPGDLGTFIEIKNFGTGQCLDVLNNSIFGAAKVATTACNGGANQKWLVRFHPACLNAQTGMAICGDYIFINLHSGLCLDVPGGNAANGLQQFTCNYGTNQRFRVTWRPSTVGGQSINALVPNGLALAQSIKVFSPGPNTNVAVGTGRDLPTYYWQEIPR